jgi:CheY-like chemotaxis protein
MESESPARILVVDDQDDVLGLLVTALELEGHEVEAAANALDALCRLEQSHYDLVLTDYAMPGGTGAWMLREATRRGLMRRSAALIMTAHPDVRDVSNFEVVTKPLDLDEFLGQVRRLVATRHRGRRVMPQASDRSRHARDTKVELVLYVSSDSPPSLEAAANLENLIARFDRSTLRVTVHDLAHEPQAADEDGIGFTPTLVKRSPEPRMWVMGNLRDPEILEDLLRVCGVEARHP